MIWATILLLFSVTLDQGSGQVDIDKHIQHTHMQYTLAMCQAIHKFSCTDHISNGVETICGTDGIQYSNKCIFAKARCFNPNLDQSHRGPCTSADVLLHSQVTTLAPSTVTWGHDPAFDLIKDVFCQNMNIIPCGNNVDADICATDGKIYRNHCLFAKVKCFEPTLEVTNPSKCGEHGLSVHTTPVGPHIVG